MGKKLVFQMQHDHADQAGLTGGQSAGMPVFYIAMLARGVQNPLTGFFADSRTVIERAVNRSL